MVLKKCTYKPVDINATGVWSNLIDKSGFVELSDISASTGYFYTKKDPVNKFRVEIRDLEFNL